MKKLIVTVFLSFSLWGFSQYSIPTASPRQKVEQQFSMTKISVDYGRPGVKGRTVFGDLVPYGKIWRAGANSATKITFEQNVNFGGKEVKAGSYALFIIPSENQWKVYLNKDANQWGAYAYDEKLNIVEITLPVQKLAEKQEWFDIAVNPVDVHSAEIIIKWDLTKVVIPVKEAKPETVAKIIDKLNEIKQIEKEAAPKK
ncbi:DUF2911 domain-containing protein [Kaistella yonginensis]|uniref:DUF2911 domain-containing protein n=1 Tax=Kaistella yonginensis TaxID=658267 RepID=UPI0025B367F1|nr:DUF2911 domain-containing protein [Kaistella yonginensis]MDN3606276.1 DUF2911 domain-containing protein [Kaistella yonginensis]